MPEEWKSVKGYEGIYEVSDLGRVRRILAAVGTKPGRILRSCTSTGYRVMSLCRNPSDHKTVKVSPIICSAFHGDKPSGRHQVNHINGITADDRAVNLEWVTPLENARHRFEVLKKTNPRGEDHWKTTVSNDDVAIMRALRARGASNGSIARQFGLPLATAKGLISGHSFKHVTAMKRIPVGYTVSTLERPSGIHHHNARLTPDAVKEIRGSSSTGRSLAARFGVSATTITNVRKGRIWKD